MMPIGIAMHEVVNYEFLRRVPIGIAMHELVNYDLHSTMPLVCILVKQKPSGEAKTIRKMQFQRTFWRTVCVLTKSAITEPA